MMGFQVSYKSVKYGFSGGNRRVPRFDALPGLMEAVNGKVFATVHYYTKSEENLRREIGAVLNNGLIFPNGIVDGLQINGIWPSQKLMADLKKAFPGLKVILQLSPDKGDIEVENAASDLARDDYGADYLLIDFSRGTGKEIDVESAADAYRMLRNGGAQTPVAFAGGLTGENVVGILGRLSSKIGTENFSIDAEGGLRDRLGDGFGNDELNMEKVRAYLRNAAKAFSK